MIPSLLAVLLLSPARAQDPHEAWRSVSTGSYRLHYPVAAEPWALEAAGRLEEIRDRTSAAVGWRPDRVVDVVVQDPYAMANGMALPTRRRPRMVLYATPPGASSGLGHYRSWAEDLIAHEDTHLVHLLRPSRSPALRGLQDAVLGIGPVAMSSPHWAIEGYATHLEGQLTGYGRPHSDFRAAFLRRWAQAGQLPAYDDLNGSDRFMGGAVPYLVGSAYLDWLALRYGEQSLRDLWARLSARRIRGFEKAFVGVYGLEPDALYGEFTAELTHAAVAAAEARPARPDTLWLSNPGSLGSPAVSPDGSRVALVVQPEIGTPVLSVYLTTEDAEDALEQDEERARLVERDPQDVPAVEPVSPEREPDVRRLRTSMVPQGPRFLQDGRLVFAAWTRHADGMYGPDVYVWDPESHHEVRVTRRADVRSPDPHPDGTWAVAVWQRWGRTGLVKVDLETGDVSPLGGPTNVDQPRLSPDGEQLAYLHLDAPWEVRLRGIATGDDRAIPLPEGLTPASLAWAPDGEALLVTAGYGGFLEAWRVPLDGGQAVPLTRTDGPVLHAEPGTDGDLWTVVLDHDGVDLHRQPMEPVQVWAPAAGTAMAPAMPPEVPLPPPAPVVPVPYGLGRPEVRLVYGGIASPAVGTTELGLRLGDVVGRHEVVSTAVLSPTLRGGGGAWVLRVLPVDVGVRAWALSSPLGDTAGGSLELSDAYVPERGELRWRAGVVGTSPLGKAVDVGLVGFGLVDASRRVEVDDGWLEGGVSGRGVGGSVALADGSAWLRAGILGAYVEAGARRGHAWAGEFTSGAVRTSFLSEGATAHQIWLPALEHGALSGGDHDARWVAVHPAGELLGLFWERHRAWSGTDEDVASLYGLRLRVDLPAQPLVALPGLDLEAGFAYVAEDPQRGALTLGDPDAVVFWMAVGWRP